MPTLLDENHFADLTAKPRIAVLGAGLMGRMLAVSFKDRFTVELFDKDNAEGQQSAAYLAAAMLAPLAESADCSKEIMQLGERALQQWPDFLKGLKLPVFFQNRGSLVLAFDQDQGDLDLFNRRLKGKGARALNKDEINRLEPGINSLFKSGLLLPNEGQLDNRALLKSLQATLESSDVIWHKEANITVDLMPDSQPVYKCAGLALEGFDWIFDCRGLGARLEAQMVRGNTGKAGEDSALLMAKGLRGVRGEVIRLYAPAVTLNRPIRLMHPRYPLYIAPKTEGVFVVGATQIESEDVRRPTVKSVLELLSACFSVHSGFAEAEILSIDAGNRPAYWDNEPKIEVKGQVVSVNGLFRHGYLLAPIMVEQCLHIVAGTSDSSPVIEIMPSLMG